MKLDPPQPFHPPRWAKGPHAQTILSHLLPSPEPDLAWQPRRLDLEAGEALRLEVREGTSGSVVIFFHGLGGHARSSYVRRSAALAAARGHSLIAVNHRGAGLGRDLARKPYHCGATGDVAAVIAFAREHFPGKQVFAVGYSLSAAMLVLLLGRDHHLSQPDGALIVNPPGDLEACSQRLLRGMNRLYDRRFVRLLRHLVTGQRGAAPLAPTATLRDFDEVYTAPQAGFRDRADYYARSSCGPFVSCIRTPAVILSAEDDPFAPASDLGPPSEAVHLHVERHGGHCGYLAAARTPTGDRRWMDYALDHYLAQLA
jgi:hypothetical protein